MRQDKSVENLTYCYEVRENNSDGDSDLDTQAHNVQIEKYLNTNCASTNGLSDLSERSSGKNEEKYYAGAKRNTAVTDRLISGQQSIHVPKETSINYHYITDNALSNLKSTRKEAVLKIDDDISFCKIVTVVYHLKDNTVIQQHYVTDATEQVNGYIGLREFDELIAVNGNQLCNKPQSYVIDIFRKLKLDRIDPDLQMTLSVYRWERPRRSDSEYSPWNEKLTQEIKLTLVPLNKRQYIEHRNLPKWWSILWKLFRQESILRLKVKDLEVETSEKKDLPDGNVIVCGVLDNPPLRKHILICDMYRRDYIHWKNSGVLYPEVLQSENDGLFYAEFFTGIDTSPAPFSYMVSGYRFYCFINGRKWYLHFDNEYGVYCQICKDNRIATDNVDERCFIKRADGDQCFLQSALIRDRFLSFECGNFTMKRIETYKLILASKGIPVKDFETCKFSVKSKPSTFLY